MKIELDLLQDALAEIFLLMKERGVENIELDADFYWHIPTDAIYDINHEPSQLDVGQLEDDYNTLSEAKIENRLIGYNLKNISSILRYLAERYPA